MSVEKVDYNLPVAKESKDVIDLIDKVLEKVMAGEELMSYTELIGELSAAAVGAEKIKGEMGSQYRNETLAYLILKLGERLAPDAPSEPAPAA